MTKGKRPGVTGEGDATQLVRFNKLLEAMRGNPKNDWGISDVEKLCQQIGMEARPPAGGGSHYKVSSDLFKGALTIPAKRPIRPVYIRLLVQWADRHLLLQAAISARAGREPGK
jgi:hypothetical protein